MKTSRLVGAFGLAILVLPRVAIADDPTTGDCLRASERGLQLKGEKRLRESREQVLLCAASSCPADVRTECERRLRAVNDAIPTVVFEVRDARGADLTAVKVSVGGTLLVERLDGTAMSFDPGEHTFVFEAGSMRGEKKLLLREGEKNRHETIVLEPPTPTTTPTTSIASPAPPARVADEAHTSEENPPGRTQRIAGVVIAGVGIVGLGIGTALGLSAKSTYDDSSAYCTGNLCDAKGGAIRDDARATGNVGTAFFFVGAVALVAGGVLWLTAPSARASARRPAWIAGQW